MSRVYNTLEEIRMKIAARCGFGGSAAASSVNAALLNSFIESAQLQIWEECNWNQLIKIADKTLGYEQNTLEYPADCDPDRVIEVSVQDGNVWRALQRGIDTCHRTYMDQLGVPMRWEMFSVAEFFPKADQVYNVRIRYVARPPRLTNDKDRVVIDDQLVFLHALANAKMHYRQPDAQSIAAQYQSLLTKLKGRARGKLVHRRGADNFDIDAMYSRPVRE